MAHTLEAEFSEVKEGLSSNMALATLNTFQLIRHDLLKGTSDENIEKIAKELEIDKALGLKTQCEITSEAALKEDIDKLTSSNDYMQVSPGLLEKLFSLQKLRNLCFWHNVKSFSSKFLKAARVSLILTVLPLVLIYPMALLTGALLPKNFSPLVFTFSILDILGWIGLSIFFVLGIYKWCNNFTMEYESLKVSLKINPLKSIDEKIPYGAKLKVLEAKNTDIFKDFVFAAPKFSIQNHTIINKLNVDPAILGVTEDKRMFMIVYWDIKKDTEKIVKEIEQFKKFKLV